MEEVMAMGAALLAAGLGTGVAAAAAATEVMALVSVVEVMALVGVVLVAASSHKSSAPCSSTLSLPRTSSVPVSFPSGRVPRSAHAFPAIGSCATRNRLRVLRGSGGADAPAAIVTCRLQATPEA